MHQQSTLVDSTPPVSESLASNSMLTLIPPDQELSKPTETVPQAQPDSLKETNKKLSKDDKEPIVRKNNRVITLPPIEAPATRSKRLQAKVETPKPKNPESIKKTEKLM